MILYLPILWEANLISRIIETWSFTKLNDNVNFNSFQAESASHSTNNDSDSDPHDLGYFKPLDSDDSDDSIQQHEV